MTHYRECDDPYACISGTKISGQANKENLKEMFVKIVGFNAKVVECKEEFRQRAMDWYSSRFNIYYGLHSMNGSHGVLEPIEGYDGPGLYGKGKREIRKCARHQSGFELCGRPAICFFDNENTRQGGLKKASVSSTNNYSISKK